MSGRITLLAPKRKAGAQPLRGERLVRIGDSRASVAEFGGSGVRYSRRRHSKALPPMILERYSGGTAMPSRRSW